MYSSVMKLHTDLRTCSHTALKNHNLGKVIMLGIRSFTQALLSIKYLLKEKKIGLDVTQGVCQFITVLKNSQSKSMGQKPLH
jgi:hypothetical protein